MGELALRCQHDPGPVLRLKRAFARFPTGTAAACALLAGCSSPQALPWEARAAFATMEERLLAASTLYCKSRLTAEGALTADLACEHALDARGRARITARGTLDGRPVELELRSDGRRLLLSSPAGSQDLSAPADLHGELVLGLTRLGWLHDVASMAAGRPPGSTDGSVGDSVRAVSLAAGEPLEIGGAARRALTFGVEIRGLRTSTAVLWLDVASGLPLERWERLDSPRGDLHLVEVYEHVELDGELGRKALETSDRSTP